MSRNLELKARLSSFSRAVRAARVLGASYEGVLRQTDTFIATQPLRLKVRMEPGRRAELIAYERSDRKGADGRWSDFVRIPLAHRRSLVRAMGGGSVTVRKSRSLFLYRNARIHLDRVIGLGSFVEFEVLDRGSDRASRKLLAELIEAFRIRESDIVGEAYADMLLRLQS